MGEWQVRAWASGRTELSGNHMDHQGGRVVSGTVEQGIEVLARRTESLTGSVRSRGFMPFEIDLSELAPQMGEAHSSVALVRGVAAGLQVSGVPLGGFELEVSTTLPNGGGLSSSAAFELAVGRALEGLFAPAGQELAPLELAKIAQRAEVEYFGKPCGLQDQSVIACGGIVALDFSQEGEVRAEPIDFDFADHGYAVCLIDTRCDHSQHNDQFAQLVNDMYDAAGYFGATRLGDVPEASFRASLRELGRKLGDRVALRGLHYYLERELVDVREAALRSGDMDAYLHATRRSSISSGMYLQNVLIPESRQQPAMLTLALADRLLGERGACRIHGGGFGGTIQAYVPLSDLEAFTAQMEDVFGRGVCVVVRISPHGAYSEQMG